MADDSQEFRQMHQKNENDRREVDMRREQVNLYDDMLKRLNAQVRQATHDSAVILRNRLATCREWWEHKRGRSDSWEESNPLRVKLESYMEECISKRSVL